MSFFTTYYMMGECERKMIMLLKQLVIKGLYNNYDYDVKFNDDVTFIYGMNGCGKTTVLNITEAIITGRIYRLFEYRFQEIILWYSLGKKKKKHAISVQHNNEDISVSFEDKTEIISKRIVSERETPTNIDEEQLTRFYLSHYDILRRIKKIFNHAYLPLNRSAHYEDDIILFRMRRNMRYQIENGGAMSGQDIVMQTVEELIKRKHDQIMLNINALNNRFRDEVLKSLLTVKGNNSILEVIDEIASKRIRKNDIIRIKENYIKIMRQLSILRDEEVSSYREFFDSFLMQYNSIEGISDLPSELASQYLEIMRIKKLVSIAEETEERKEKEYRPIKIFIETINEFIFNEIDRKQIHISSSGEVYLTIRNNSQKIGINALSSGEKQLVIFFANLIFGIQKDTTGIFIVDEPELSLHLSWQAVFIEKALSINDNIQLIFATHSPEIIGKYTDRMFELVKKPSSKENKDE